MDNRIKSLPPQRRLQYDAIRVFAMLSVIVLHISAYVVLAYTDNTSKEFIVGNIFNGIVRSAVPLL